MCCENWHVVSGSIKIEIMMKKCLLPSKDRDPPGQFVSPVKLWFIHLIIHNNNNNNNNNNSLPPWIRSFDLLRHRLIAIVSWGVHDLFFLKVCS